MKLYIKQKIFTLGEKFTVWDQNGQAAYYVQGSFLTIPKNFEIYDAMGHKVAKIERHLFKIFARYNITTNTRTVSLQRNFSFFRQSFSVEGINWQIQGDFFSHEYRILENNRTIMHLSKHWFKIGDSYELEINDEKNAALALALVIAIDYEILKDTSNNNG